ncbi:MAG: hypothetical protein ACREBF_03740 [Candidatus Micrarchaeales archaeon]
MKIQRVEKELKSLVEEGKLTISGANIFESNFKQALREELTAQRKLDDITHGHMPKEQAPELLEQITKAQSNMVDILKSIKGVRKSLIAK